MPRKKIMLPARQHYERKPTVQTMRIPTTIEEKTKYTGMAMSVEDMADELAIGRNVAYQLIKQPGFPAFMIGRRILINRKGLQLWIDRQCEAGADISIDTEAKALKPIEK